MGGRGKARAGARGRGIVAVGAALATVMGVIPVSAALPGLGGSAPNALAAAEVLEAVELRMVEADDVGLPNPTGLAYDPARKEFLLAADNGQGTTIVRLDPLADPLGTLSLPAVANPSTLTFDGAGDRLTSIEDDDLLEVDGPDLTSRRPPTERVPLAGAGGGNPASSSIDPDTNTLFVLDQDTDTVTLSDLEGVVDRAPVELAQSDANRLIAFNTTDGLLYVLDPDADRIEALDADGTVVESLGTASIGFMTPEAMTFAPSTDGTDDPANLNLFVADSGTDDNPGGLIEVTPGGDGVFGNGDDQVTQINAGSSPISATDTEEPAFDPVSGDLFFLSGTDQEIFRLDPVDGIFGNGNDTVTHFDIGFLGSSDYEGLALSPGRGTLYVGQRTDTNGIHRIFEITFDGVLVRTINMTISSMRFLSGLAIAPASTNP